MRNHGNKKTCLLSFPASWYTFIMAPDLETPICTSKILSIKIILSLVPKDLTVIIFSLDSLLIKNLQFGSQRTSCYILRHFAYIKGSR